MTGEIETQTRYLLRYYSVFNSEQCTFDEIGEQKIRQLSGATESRFNERFLGQTNNVENMPDRHKISLGLYDSPCYFPSLDEVRIPDLKYFFNSDAFYAAYYHELAQHWRQAHIKLF